jgi:hypothetical protein
VLGVQTRAASRDRVEKLKAAAQRHEASLTQCHHRGAAGHPERELVSRCSVCSSPQVAELDAALAAGESIRATARKFGVPRSTLGRHAAHLIADDADPRPALLDADAGRRALAVLDESLELVERAESTGRAPEILIALRGARAAARALVRAFPGPATDRDRAVVEGLYERSVGLYGRVQGIPRLEQAAMATMRGLLADVRKIADHDDDGEVRIRLVFADGTPTGPGSLVPRSALGPGPLRDIKLTLPGQQPSLGSYEVEPDDEGNGNGHGG